MARKKAGDGVQATIERLTGKTPCPKFLRDALNKYLYQEQLFEGAKNVSSHRGARKLGRLHCPNTDNLVRNLLDLDALFCGDTTTVTGVVAGTIDANDLSKKLDDVERTMRQRMEIYGYWLDRMSSVRAVLGESLLDLRVGRLDEKLSAVKREGIQTVPSFALHALRLQEASEAKGRSGLPSAVEYVERAEAYLALDDLANADRNASLAIVQDSCNARGWFIRVATALRRRQTALRAFNQKRMEAQECAEPLSAHERWALEQADEAACQVHEHQRSLDEILPQAILHWPRTSGRRDHAELWKQVRQSFVDRMFSIAADDVRDTITRQQWGHMRGSAPELELGHQTCLLELSTGRTGCSSFTTEQSQAISSLLTEYDSKPQQFFDLLEFGRIATDFRLYHLRYVLRMDGCDGHWIRLQAAISGSPADWWADYLMRDATVAKLWQLHYCSRGHAPALMQFYAEWLRKMQAQSNGRLQAIVLRQYTYLYHHHYSSRQFELCGEVAASAIELLDDPTTQCGWIGNEPHPYDDSISMPIHHSVYWEYLAAVAAVEQRRQNGEISAHARAILADEVRWRKAFSELTKCFWTASEEYEDGGGEDWPEPPYGIDLREPENWARETHPTERQISHRGGIEFWLEFPE